MLLSSYFLVTSLLKLHGILDYIDAEEEHMPAHACV